MQTEPRDGLGLPPGLVEHARTSGVGFYAGPEDLGLETMGQQGILSLLQSYPRDETVVLLACSGVLLHWLGEMSHSVQEEGVKAWMRGTPRDRALDWMARHPNGVIFTYEAGVRLALLAMHYGDPASRELDDAEVSQLMSMLPEVQTWLARLDTLSAPGRVKYSVDDNEDTAFTLFLMVNSPGMGTSTASMVISSVLGAIAARHTKLTGKHGRQAATVLGAFPSAL